MDDWGETLAVVNAAKQAAEKLSTIEASKRLAAWTAVDRHVKPQHKVIGIGSGTPLPPALFNDASADVHMWGYRIDGALCCRTDRTAGYGIEQRTGVHPYRYVSLPTVFFIASLLTCYMIFLLNRFPIKRTDRLKRSHPRRRRPVPQDRRDPRRR